MRRNSRSPQPPLFTVNRPIAAAWNWEVTYKVASSGYVTQCHVGAWRREGEELLVGTAWCEVSLYDLLSEVLECLVVEAMLAACEPTLDGSATTRRIQYSSHL